MPWLLQHGGVQLNKLISSSADAGKINEKIITYLIVKSFYNGSDTDLAGLCDILDELIVSTDHDIPTCVQQIRCGMYKP